MPAAIEFQARHDWPAVRARCHALALDAKRTIEQFFGTQAICPEDFGWFSQLCPIRLPDNTDTDKLGKLMREQYQIEMPMISWNHVKMARLSVQIYTSPDELDVFVEAITTLVAACQI